MLCQQLMLLLLILFFSLFIFFFFSFYSVSYSVHVSEDYPGTVQRSCPRHMHACYHKLLYLYMGISERVLVSFRCILVLIIFHYLDYFQSFLPFRRHLSAGSQVYRDWSLWCSPYLEPTLLGVRKCPAPLGMADKTWSFKRLSSLA